MSEWGSIGSKKEYQKQRDQLGMELGRLQRAFREKGIPVVIVLEGSSEKARDRLLKSIVMYMDPRSFRVISFAKRTKGEKQKPYIWRFWQRLPKKGEICIYAESWYEKLYRMYEKKKRAQITVFTQRIVALEQEWEQEGILLLKFYADDDNMKAKGEKRRVEIWEQIKRNAESMQNRFYTVKRADTWEGSLSFLSMVQKALKEELSKRTMEVDIREKNMVAADDQVECSKNLLAKVDLEKDINRKYYKKQMNGYQKRLAMLQEKMEKKKKAMVIVLEGWDAAGKGGAIKRITKGLDPRKYQVIPTGAPNELEKSYPYLWRFWRNVPNMGEIIIFDRSWYGRVMVEPIEGFCSPEDLQRAYGEINQMEADWQEAGILVLKFWLHIDKEEQEKRFLARQKNPEKQWKLTSEDWRNRGKWDIYEKMVNTMLARTSTVRAPWIIVEANSKYYARLKIMENILYHLEQHLLED